MLPTRRTPPQRPPVTTSSAPTPTHMVCRVTISNCSNNYGPYQFPEKLIPLMILNALTGKPLPVYGDGQQIRDWLYVEDHCEAIHVILEKGALGETYNVGGGNQPANLRSSRPYAICSTSCDPHPHRTAS